MKIESQTLTVAVENIVKVGKNKELELLVEHQIIAYTDYKGEMKCDVDLVDVRDIVFNGKEQKGDDYAYFMKKLREMGLEYDDEADEAIEDLIPVSLIEEVKEKYKSIL